MFPRAIVIGASAGGLEPLREVISKLPAGFAAPVFVVLHVPAYYPSPLPEILSRAGALPALHPEDHSRVEAAHIYVAPPDHHLLIDDGHVAVKKGPKENGFRPSIDALFRSAAYTYGPAAVGVVLSGALNDGTSGLWSIKRLGGTAVVQDPSQATYPSMPRSALEYIEADYRGSPAAIGSLLARLVREQPASAEAAPAVGAEDAKRMALETQIAAGVQLPEEAVLGLGELTEFTCPECRGTLVKITEGRLSRFRCHTGHAYTADALLAQLMESVTDLLWQTMRGSQELSMLLEHMAGHLQESGDAATAEVYLERARSLNRQAGEMQKFAMAQESLSEGKLDQEAPRRRGEDTAGDRPG